AAYTAVDSLRAAGARVIVLLSQLGEKGGDSLVAHVPGIDLLVAGSMVPVNERGRRVRETGAGYGGAPGWEVGVAEVQAGEHPRIEARTVVLGPEYGMEPAMAASVKMFEDSLNAKMRARDAAFAPAVAGGAKVSHFVSMSSCGKCHASEYAQW